jgi:hypothetical protein
VRKGFSYIQAIITCSLSLLLIAYSLVILQSTLHILQRPPQLVSPLLDIISTDIQYATAVQADTDSITVTTPDDQYRYTLLNKRLARIRDGILYLSPATPNLTTFTVNTTDNRYFELTLATAYENQTRIVRRRN